MIKRVVLSVYIGLLFNPFFCFSQDSIPKSKEITEENNIKFQEYFFKSLSEKSIKNYQKAIENLEVCNSIIPENKSIYFEFSKNYLLLSKTIEAKIYIDLALGFEPNNIWMLSHLIAIQTKEKNFKGAINTQLKLIQLNPKYRTELVRLYYLDGDYVKALSLISILEKEKGLTKNLKQLKDTIELIQKPKIDKVFDDDLTTLIYKFENNKPSFSNLKKILEIASKTNTQIYFKYSKLAINLFPAQPFSYLFMANSLNYQNNYHEAIEVLETGMDFVFDNPVLERQFYSLLIEAYTNLNNVKKVSEYKQKLKKT